jgi:hypothetical protein
MTRAFDSADVDALLASAGTYRSTIVVSAMQAAQALTWTTARGDTLRASVGNGYRRMAG